MRTPRPITVMQFIQLLLAVWLVSSFYSCTTKTIIVRYEGRIVERYQVLYKSNLRHGFYRIYHENGNLALEHTYKDGQLDGVETIYHEDGSLAGVLALEGGKYQGSFVYYHPEGGVKQNGYYKNDKLEGLLCSYYKNGKLKECVTVKNNVENGPFREYASNGALIRQGNYISLLGDEEGLEDGLLYEYDAESRKLMLKKRCKEGFCCTLWEREKGYLRPSTSICDEIMNETKSPSNVLGSD